MGNYMKIICLKEKYLAKKLYICTRKACEAAHARQNEQVLGLAKRQVD